MTAGARKKIGPLGFISTLRELAPHRSCCIQSSRLAFTALVPTQLQQERVRMRRVGFAVVAVGATALLGARLSAGDLRPGLQPGDTIGPFNIKEVVGPNEADKGKSFCYV